MSPKTTPMAPMTSAAVALRRICAGGPEAVESFIFLHPRGRLAHPTRNGRGLYAPLLRRTIRPWDESYGVSALARKVGLALLQEGGERFACRGLAQHGAEVLALGAQLRFDRSGMGAAQQRLGDAQRFRGQRRELARRFPRSLGRFRRRHRRGSAT